jgi:hypothetical protein
MKEIFEEIETAEQLLDSISKSRERKELDNLAKRNEVDVLDEIHKEMVVEIRELRKLREDSDGDFSKISLTRMDALSRLAMSVVKKREIILKGAMNLDAPIFEEVFKFFLESARDTMKDLKYSTEDKQALFTQLLEKLEGWKSVVRRRVDTTRIDSPKAEDAETK